jgi:hypothetical protein
MWTYITGSGRHWDAGKASDNGMIQLRSAGSESRDVHTLRDSLRSVTCVIRSRVGRGTYLRNADISWRESATEKCGKRVGNGPVRVWLEDSEIAATSWPRSPTCTAPAVTLPERIIRTVHYSSHLGTRGRRADRSPQPAPRGWPTASNRLLVMGRVLSS